MITYLEKYNSLPAELRNAISTPEIMAVINEIEGRYRVNLATIIMRVMVKDIALEDLANFFVFEYNMENRQAEELLGELADKIFYVVADYLGFNAGSGGEAAEAVQEGETAMAPASPDQSAKEADIPGPGKGGPAADGASFYFDTEDEEEVREQAKKVADYTKDISVKREVDEKNWQAIVNKVVYEMGLNFSSEELHNRYWQIVYTFVRGVRDRMETKDALKRNIADGGVDLNDALADKTINLAKEIKQKSVQGEPIWPDGNEQAQPVLEAIAAAEPGQAGGEIKPGVPLPPDKGSGMPVAGERDIAYDFNALKERGPERAGTAADKIAAGKPLDMETINLRKSKGERAGTSPLPMTAAKDKVIDLKKPAAVQKAPLPAATPEHIKASPPKSRFFNLTSSKREKEKNGKVLMSDIKRVTKLTGPIDELKEMDLLNFRRLSPDSDQAAHRIMEKIEFLEEDSYAQRLNGIKAWRQSPVNKQYIQMGEASIREHKSVTDIIHEYQDQNKDSLTYQEFNAIMELNKGLRF